MHHIKDRIYSLFLLLFISLSVCGQSPIPELEKVANPFTQHFNYKIYNGSADNWSIIQDERGVMYFGNLDGIIEYDGKNWRKIVVPGIEGVRTSAMDSTGTIYFAAYGDFGYIGPDSVGQMQFNSLLPYLEDEHKNFGEMWDVAATKEAVFFKSADKIFRFKDNKITVWDSVFAFRLYNINDKMYSRNQDVGLMVIEGDSIKVMEDGAFFEDTGVYDMLPYEKNDSGKTNKILVTTNYSGMYIHDGGKFRAFKTDADELIKKSQIYNACITSDGNIALATQRGGLFVISKYGKLLKVLNDKSGLSTNVIYDVYPDDQGGLWLATGNGIYYSEIPSPFAVIENAGDLKEQSFDVIRYRNDIYAANSLGVMKFNKSELTFDLLQGSNKPVYSFFDANGILLALTNWGPALIGESGSFEVIDEGYVISMVESKLFPGRIYSGGSRGFSIFTKNDNEEYEFQLYNEMEVDIANVAEDVEGNVWMASMLGNIYLIDSDSLSGEISYDKNLSLRLFLPKEELPGSFINMFPVQEKILISTDRGVYRIDNDSGKLQKDTIFGNLFSNPNTAIPIIKKSYNDDFWILTETNDSLELGKAVLKNDGSYEWTPIRDFRRLNLDAVLNFYPDYYEDTKVEKLWLNTDEGLIVFNPSAEKNYNKKFSTLIREVKVNNDSLIYGGVKAVYRQSEPVLSYDLNDIRFEFSATSFDKPENTLFQFFLDGNDEEWSLWTSEIKKEYTNLSHGDYTFRVRSKNIYGFIGKEDQFSFKVSPPWYLTYWAYLFYAFLLGLGVFIVDKIQRGRLIRKERDRAKLREADLTRRQAEELETVDRLVRVINKADNLDILFNSLIDQTISFIPQAEKSVIFLLDKKIGLFRAAYAYNYDSVNLENVTFAPEELRRRYTEKSEEVEKGIYILSDTEVLYGDSKMSVFNKAKSILVMAVEREGIIEAFVVFDSFADKQSFDPSAARILNRFREHAVSAISKAQSLKSLKEKNDEIIRTQEQLVMQQKLASLGSLTAGIAHEIKNPLNFVNNFAEISSEMIEELSTVLENEKALFSEENYGNIKELIQILEENLVKINNHGKRADSIIKGMLLHSRGKFGEKSKTNINDLLEQYVNLAYHGLRAQDRDFNITIEKDYDKSLEDLEVIPQDISRVFLNLINNACYAATEKKGKMKSGFNPSLSVSTKNLADSVEIRIRDNGNGIPDNIKKDIFNPFFTTKPAGKGTGLGLSISYDIIVKGHGGSLEFDTKTGEYTEFIIKLPKRK